MLLSFEKAAYGLQGQFRSLEEGTQEKLVVSCLSESGSDLSSKMKHIVGNEVGELTGLRVPPHMFRRVEFRGVWREPLDFESRAVPRLQDRAALR